MKGLPKRVIFGTETMDIIFAHEVPYDRKTTYERICYNYRKQKEQKHRCNIMVREDRTDYHGEVSTKTSDKTTIKMIFNSVTSCTK